MTENFATKALESTKSLFQDEKNTTFPACPFTWSTPLHEYNCDVIWPKEYVGGPGHPLIELDTDQYLGRIGREKMVEKLLAMAGLRLAKVLNEALAEVEVDGVEQLGFEAVKGIFLDY